MEFLNWTGNTLTDDSVRRYETCIRCQREIYPTEKADVGVAMHKNCFRCVACNVTLTLSGAIIARPDHVSRPAVYCQSHAPKPIKFALDEQSMEIQCAVKAQRINENCSFNKQDSSQYFDYVPHWDQQKWTQSSMQDPSWREPLNWDHIPRDTRHVTARTPDFYNQEVRYKDLHGWEYDAKAMEFEHVKNLQDRNRRKCPGTHEQRQTWKQEANYEDILERLQNGNLDREGVKDMASKFVPSRSSSAVDAEQAALLGEDDDYWPPPPLPGSMPSGVLRFTSRDTHDRITLDTSSESGSHESEDSIYEPLDLSRCTPSQSQVVPEPALTFDKARLADVLLQLYRSDALQLPAIKKMSKGYQEYETISRNTSREYLKEKAFMEQNELERRQRHEHSEMFREITSARQQEINMLEADLRHQMEQAVRDLVQRMEQGVFHGDISQEKQRIEQHFQRMKNEKMRSLLDRISGQERMRLDDILDKQAREMLELIDKKMPAQLPSPKPSRKRKIEVVEGPQVFDEVDFHAIQVAQSEHDSFTDLVYDLTRNCKSQVEKARAIFRWITVKDLNTMIFSSELTEESPYYFLQGIKYGLESYHELFKRLCSYGGLKVKIVRGFSKSVGYKPGMQFTSGRFRNTWAAVYIDGEWRFIDCHWGSRHVSSSRNQDDITVDASGGFCYELDEFFFLTDPQDHVYMHYPDDSDWQLLQHKMTLEQFIDQPVVKSHFFTYGLRLPQGLPGVINTSNGKVEIVLSKTNGEGTPLAFSTRLESDEEVLDGYCIHHNDTDEVVFNLSLPRKGVFYFTIFACDTDKADSYNNICCFKICCSKVVNPPFCKFPRLPHGYGPTSMAKELGLQTEKYDEYYLVANEDRMILTIKFKVPVKVSHRVMSGAYDEHSETLNRLVFQRYRDDKFVSYLLRFPEKGIYLFSLFASEQRANSPMLECACRYLIQCNVNPESAIKPYPKAQPNWLRCRLHEPSTGDLKIEKNVKFKLEVTDALAVAVIVGSHWYYLKQTGGPGSKLWEGVAFTGRDPTATADVYARYGKKSRDFFPLLEYKLVQEEFI